MQVEAVVAVVHEGVAVEAVGASPAVVAVAGGVVALGEVEEAGEGSVVAGVGSAEAGVGAAASVDEGAAGFDTCPKPRLAVLQADAALQLCGHCIVALHACMTDLVWPLTTRSPDGHRDSHGRSDSGQQRTRLGMMESCAEQPVNHNSRHWQSSHSSV